MAESQTRKAEPVLRKLPVWGPLRSAPPPRVTPSGRRKLGQHRTIVPASLSRLFAPLLQFEKREIHTVFLRFPNFELGQKSWLSLLVKLCGVALEAIAQAMGKHLGEVFTVEHDMEPVSDELYWPITG